MKLNFFSLHLPLVASKHFRLSSLTLAVCRWLPVKCLACLRSSENPKLKELCTNCNYTNYVWIAIWGTSFCWSRNFLCALCRVTNSNILPSQSRCVCEREWKVWMRRRHRRRPIIDKSTLAINILWEWSSTVKQQTWKRNFIEIFRAWQMRLPTSNHWLLQRTISFAFVPNTCDAVTIQFVKDAANRLDNNGH